MLMAAARRRRQVVHVAHVVLVEMPTAATREQADAERDHGGRRDARNR